MSFCNCARQNMHLLKYHDGKIISRSVSRPKFSVAPTNRRRTVAFPRRVQEAGTKIPSGHYITSPGQGCHLAARVRTAIEAKLRIINVCVGSLMDRGLPFEHVECGSSCERVIRSFFARYNVLATPGCGIIKSPPPPHLSHPPFPSSFRSVPPRTFATCLEAGLERDRDR